MKKIILISLLSIPFLVSGQQLANETKLKQSPFSEEALYILDDKVISYNDVVRDSESKIVSVKSLAPQKINTIQVLKDKAATDKYGDAGKNGVIIFITKKYDKKVKKKDSLKRV